MKNKVLSHMLILLTVVMCVPFTLATTGKVLYRFQGGTSGQYPTSIIVDSAGNLYGTAFLTESSQGCQPAYCPIVFELSPGTHGNWTYQILYEFPIIDGSYGTGLTIDEAGNLYGTQYYGGVNGYGFVFELSPGANGTWTEKDLYDFGSYSDDGRNPESVLVFDASGNLYGTTNYGGENFVGTVFELMPSAEGWTENILYSFGPARLGDGENPTGPLIFDSAGNLYGTTPFGGNSWDLSQCVFPPDNLGCGIVFQLVPPGNSGGSWTENVVYNFQGYSLGGDDGAWPFSGVILDSEGNLYGTTIGGGFSQYGGTVFELSQSGGGWTEIVACRSSATHECASAESPVTLDNAGHLYGEAPSAGTARSGMIYRLTRRANPQLPWNFEAVYTFSGGADGASPEGGLITDSAGNFYGVAYDGGNAQGMAGDGVIFEGKP